ncbi:MAG TPA: glycosyl hydrolase family 8 [Chitinispirillaceae bacterium]|nr:glycosyl hydrolase family 8 [Chitinispirillaceae bacterium]
MTEISSDKASVDPKKVIYSGNNQQFWMLCTFKQSTLKPFFMVSLLVLTFLAIPSVAQSTTTTKTPVAGEVKIAINSGNPALPFPQFNAYANNDGILENLGTRNSVGNTHAEMEQVIRDAYQIMMNRAEYPGGGVGGTDYVYFISQCNCSEGDGYAMLGAVAMADKKTFDGLWLWVHDNFLNKAKRYKDCKLSSPDYKYSQLPSVYHIIGQNSAADGDFDIAMALLLAYKQWGEFMGIDDACGNPISYKQAAIDFLKGLTDTLTFVSSGSTLLSGDIGLDGYFKGGDSWAEFSGWSTQANLASIGINKRVEQAGPNKQFFDYTAPSYFRAFADFLSKEDSAKYAWNIFQFRRAEASSNWLIGKQYQSSPKNLPISGGVEITDTTPTFYYTGDLGEDFRLGWRTILNHLWYGNPTSSWNPKTHLVENNKPNTDLYKMAIRYANYIWDSRQAPWNNTCVPSVGTDPFSHWGPATLVTNTAMDGTRPADAFFFLNWLPAVGSPSAIISQNHNLMADLYRYLEIEWDTQVNGDRYLTSVPKYFHGWYRVLGLLLLSGNYQSPENIKPTANMKVYLSTDKTFAFNNDSITYTIDYRNYGSLDAKDVIISDTLHPDFVYISSTGSGNYDNASHTVNWNIGTVPGFKTATGVTPTKGQVKLVIKIKNPTEKQYRNKATISLSNGSGWTSSEYPNTISTVMERNYLDIAKRALIIEKSASKVRALPGSTVEYTIDFKNSSEAGWINGGRPGVHFSFALSAKGKDGKGTAVDQARMNFRMFHDAQEAYIDYGNYRLSYFAYDTLLKSVTGGDWANPAWVLNLNGAIEGIDKSQIKLVHENIVEGQDSLGKWNQRIIIQFSDPTDPDRIINLATIDRHLSGYRGTDFRIHRGGTSPFRAFWYVSNSAWSPINWSDDWSFDPDIDQDEALSYFPITNDWSDPDKPDIPVNTWNAKACSTSQKTVNNILVEEWDGYTWRRVAGNGPMPGREANNVLILDTIPTGFTFGEFTSPPILGISPKINGRIVSWSIPHLQIQQGGTIKYTVNADGSCPGASDRTTISRAWISADKESPYSDSVIVTISCDTTVPPPTPDHIDIVLDTTTFDRYNDEPFSRLTLDAGNLSQAVYAIIRDKSGAFLKYAASATWTSRNESVATVKAGSDKSNATITKVEKGATFIVVSDPSLPGNKSDSVAITVIPAPPWPAIAEAIMLDKNADLIPDSMKIRLNRTFETNQKLDSVVVFYRGEYISLPASSVNLNDTIITFSINNLTATDPRPSGTAYLKMTVDGSAKQGSKSIVDGIGPAILEARLYESANRKNDTLMLVFSEEVHTMNFDSKTLQLIKSGSNDTVAVSILGVSPAGIYIQARVALPEQSSNRPEVGDYIRFLPGEKGGSCIDVSLNLTHLKNKAVVIKSGPPSIVKAWYTDNNADGIVKDVYVRFLRSVDISNISFTMNWVTVLASNVRDKALSYHNNDSTTVHVVLPDDFTNATSIKTIGKIFVKPEFLSTNEFQTGWATDSAAPVIIHASISAAGVSDDIKVPDTLRVVFSEPASIINTVKPFVFTSQKNVPYTMNLSLLSVKDTLATFLINDYDPATYPASGDSIRIYTNAVKDTSGNVQSVERNRNAPVSVKQGDFKIHIKAGPNPLNTNGDAIRISAAPNGKFKTGIELEAKVSIFDNLGSCVISETSMNVDPQTQEAVFEWKGLNRRGRKVGTGTYIAVVKAKSVIGETSEKILIGVRNEKVDEKK